MNLFIRCRAVMLSGEALVTHTEVHEDAWVDERGVVVRSLIDGIEWQAGLRNEIPNGDIEFVVIKTGFRPEEIERGTL